MCCHSLIFASRNFAQTRPSSISWFPRPLFPFLSFHTAVRSGPLLGCVLASAVLVAVRPAVAFFAASSFAFSTGLVRPENPALLCMQCTFGNFLGAGRICVLLLFLKTKKTFVLSLVGVPPGLRSPGSPPGVP